MIIAGDIKKTPGKLRFLYIKKSIADLGICCGGIDLVEICQHTSLI
jgi:hypothetical protein